MKEQKESKFLNIGDKLGRSRGGIRSRVNRIIRFRNDHGDNIDKIAKDLCLDKGLVVKAIKNRRDKIEK